jgi:hypothetical protein
MPTNGTAPTAQRVLMRAAAPSTIRFATLTPFVSRPPKTAARTSAASSFASTTT